MQILREINVKDSWSAKSALLSQLKALNFDIYQFLHLLKAFTKLKTNHSFYNGKNSICRTSRLSKIDFTKHLSAEKFWNFHTVVGVSWIQKLVKYESQTNQSIWILGTQFKE